MLFGKKSIPRHLRSQIDAALAREGVVARDAAEAVNILVNLYHGYRNAYEGSGAATGGPDPAADNSDPGDKGGSDTEIIYRPVYDFDGLMSHPKIIHNHDFMRDPAFVDAYRAGVDALQHDHRMYWRLHVALYFATRGLKLEGDFVECGVWRGFLSAAIAKYTNWASVPKTFYLFDTFEGLAEDKLTDAERSNPEKIAHLNRHFADSFGAARSQGRGR